MGLYSSTDIMLSIATLLMSLNPKRIFSLTGLLLTASHARLQFNIITTVAGKSFVGGPHVKSATGYQNTDQYGHRGQ